MSSATCSCFQPSSSSPSTTSSAAPSGVRGRTWHEPHRRRRGRRGAASASGSGCRRSAAICLVLRRFSSRVIGTSSTGGRPCRANTRWPSSAKTYRPPCSRSGAPCDERRPPRVGEVLRLVDDERVEALAPRAGAARARPSPPAGAAPSSRCRRPSPRGAPQPMPRAWNVPT